MIDESMLTAMLISSASVFAAMEKFVKPTFKRLCETYNVTDDTRYLIYQVIAFLGALVMVLMTEGMSFLSIGGVFPTNQTMEVFDILITAAMLALGDEAIHRGVDLLRIWAGLKTVKVAAVQTKVKAASDA